jgi:hypothetical protein
MLALLTRQSDVLKTERFFNTFGNHVAVYYMAVYGGGDEVAYSSNRFR